MQECDGVNNCFKASTFEFPVVDNKLAVRTPLGPEIPASIGGFKSYHRGAQWMQTGDFNGDGKMDYMWIPLDQEFWNVAYSTGNGFKIVERVLTISNEGFRPYHLQAQYMRFADYNGDGKMDLMWIPQGQEFWNVAYATDTGFTVVERVLPASIGGFKSYHSGAQWMQTGDFNGDGKMDYMWIPLDQEFWNVAYATGTGFSVVERAIPMGIGGANSYHLAADYMRFADYNGDGRMDLMWMPNWQEYWNVAYATDTGFTIVERALPASIGGFKSYHSGAQWMRTGDFNGDGKMDYMWIPLNQEFWNVAYSTGTGFSVVERAIPMGIGGANSYHLAADYMRFADYNGDGRMDFMWMPNWQEYWNVAYATDTGFTIVERALPASIGGFKTYHSGAQWMRTGDFNGDGKMDYMWIPLNQEFWNVAYATGTGFSVVERAIPMGIGGANSYHLAADYMRFADYNGDGRMDYMWLPNWQEYWNVAYASSASTYINKIVTSTGNVVDITYAPITDASVYTKDVGAKQASYPVLDLQIPLHVVSSVSSDNGVGGANTTQYSYGGLKAQAGTGRGALGFRWSQSLELATGIQRYNEYRQDYPYTGMLMLSETRLAGAGKNGVLKRTLQYAACKIPLNGSACVVAERCDRADSDALIKAACTNAANSRYFVHTANSVEESWDLDGAPFPTISTSTQFAADALSGQHYGDVGRITINTQGGASKVTTNEYLPADTNNWILGRLKRAQVTSSQTNDSATITSAGSVAAPTISAEQIPAVWVTGTSGSLNWNSTNASSVSVNCSANDNGFTMNDLVQPNGSITLTASPYWVNAASNCRWTASGPGGISHFDLTVRTALPARVPIEINVGAQNNYNASVDKVPAYLAGYSDVTFNVTGNIGSNTTGSYAFTVDNTWAPGDTVNVRINSGVYIVGAGGNGGGGWSGPGGAGGPAIQIKRATTITNAGVVGGGGGGGAGTGAPGGGGGGGAGLTSGPGGPAYCDGGPTSTFGSNGSLTAGGAGGPSAPLWYCDAGVGGAGGALGAAGSPAVGNNRIAPAGAALTGKQWVNGGAGLSGTVYGAQQP